MFLVICSMNKLYRDLQVQWGKTARCNIDNIYLQIQNNNIIKLLHDELFREPLNQSL